MKRLTMTEFLWAIYFTLLGIVWMIIEKVIGLHDVHIDKHSTYTSFFGIAATIFVVFFMRHKRKQLANENSYLELLKSGIFLSIIISILSPLSQYIIFEFITPNYFTNMKNYVTSTNAMSLEEAEKMFNFSSYIIQSTFFGLGMGILTSAIVAIFFRKSIKEQ